MCYKSDGNAEGHGEDWAATDSLGTAPPSSQSITPKGPLFTNLDEARHAISDSSLQLPPSSSSSVNVSDPTGSARSPPSSRHMELMSSHRPVRQRCLTPFSATASTDAKWTKTPPDPSHIVSGFDFSSSASNSVGTQLHHGTGKENSASLELPDIEDSVEDIYNSDYMQSAADEIRQSRTVRGTPLSNDYPCHSEARIQSVYYEPPQMALPKLPDGHQGAKHLTNGSGNWPVNFSRPMWPLNSVSNPQDLMAVPTDSSQTSGLGSHATPTGNASDTARLATNNLDPEFVIYGSLPAQPDNISPKDQLCPERDINHGGGSNVEASTDSDKDPFQYNRGSFTAFLQPARKRKVSVALRYGDSTALASQPGGNDSPGARLPRTLKGAGHPVFLPKPRIHRVNGYLHNSRCITTDTTTGSCGNNSARSAPVEKINPSIRIRTAKKRAHRRNVYLNESQSDSSFQSLDSTSSKHPGRTNGALMIGAALDCETMPPSIKMAAIGRRKRQGNEANKGLPASPIPREPARAHLKDNNNPTGPVPLGSPTLFSFPSTSLQEAVKRAAIRSANENNLTVTGKSSSMIPSKAIQRTTPPTPHIAKPSTAHSYRPSSASILGISMTYRGFSEYFEERMLIGHDRGHFNATSNKSATTLTTGRSALSRAFRFPPIEPAGTSTMRSIGSRHFPIATTSHGVYVFDSPPRLVPRDKRDAAHAAAALAATHTTTSLRQMAALEEGGHSPFVEDRSLSWEARRRRQAYYYFLCVLCVLPFMALLVCNGKLDSALSWYTRGETESLTRRQRRNLRVIGTAISVVWLVAIAVFVTIAATMSAHGGRYGTAY